MLEQIGDSSGHFAMGWWVVVVVAEVEVLAEGGVITFCSS